LEYVSEGDKEMSTTNNKYTIISGKAHWASLITPNTTFEPCWSLDVSLDETNKKKAAADGLVIKNKNDNRGDFVTIKRKVTKRDGSPRQAPEVIDAAKNPWNGDLIGNGSVVNVKYQPYEYTVRGKKGRSADLVKVQVVELVPYGGGKDDGFDVIHGGYTVGAKKDSDALADDIPF
jgi:hypothetical protein